MTQEIDSLHSRIILSFQYPHVLRVILHIGTDADASIDKLNSIID